MNIGFEVQFTDLQLPPCHFIHGERLILVRVTSTFLYCPTPNSTSSYKTTILFCIILVVVSCERLVVVMEIDSCDPGIMQMSEVSLDSAHEISFSRSRDESASGVYLVWQDLSVILNNIGDGPTKRLLHRLNGFAEPGRIVAIMGPSGSGKSTLLDSLAGRLSRNVTMTGNVLLNGKKMKPDYGIAYVTQEDVLLGTLTVRETITYSAQLRLPSSMNKQDMEELIESTIMDMGLQECADRVIGNWHLRGISGGEKKRLNIAVEILTRPPLLFLDEPTSGLDSAAAFFVVQILRNIAHDGRTVVSSIHQPSSEVFAQFDDLFLLSGGETIYFGEAKMAVQFFKEAGFPCPSRRNPSDHFLRCINTDFDTVTAILKGALIIHQNSLWQDSQQQSSDPLMNMTIEDIKDKLVEKYRRSSYATVARKRGREILLAKTHMLKSNIGSQASWWKQFSTLTRRSFVNMNRDIGYYWLRIIIYTLVALCVGTIFFDVGTGYSAIFARGSSAAFITGFMTFMSIGGFPSFVEEMKAFSRERLNRYYGVGAFILSNFFSSLPFLVAVSVISGTITYYMVKFHAGFSHYTYAMLIIFSCIAVIESCMMVVASLVPNYMMGLITGAGILGIMMMSSGYFRFLPDLPKPIWRYPISYISYGAWALQGQYKNDMIGLEFDPLVPGDPKIKGEDVIENIFGIQLDHSKWWDLGAVISILISYRLIFFMVLKFKEWAIPYFCKLYAEVTIQKLKKRASFRKGSFRMGSFRMGSFRRQPSMSFRETTPHPLSFQEGLSSPVP